jgi:hypothetical protein
MRDQLVFCAANCGPDEARVTLRPDDDSSIASINGFVRGPLCAYSKTLTADYALRPVDKPTFTHILEALVLDPCYWTPLLPFLYDLNLAVLSCDASVSNEVLKFGMKRWHCESRNLRLQLRRIVLRGTLVSGPDEDGFRRARKHEVALMVDGYSERVCELGGQIGVPLVVDLRKNTSKWEEVFRALDWHPAVFLSVLNKAQILGRELSYHWPRASFIAVCVGSADEFEDLKCDAYAVELQPGERPPAWAATCDKPVIVIRKDPESNIHTARAGCDKLQAELAPEFDLAGYFV